MNMGWYLYYKYKTGRNDGVPSWMLSVTEVLPQIMAKFHPRRQTTLADCEAEARHFDLEHRRHDQEAWEAHMQWEAAEKRAKQIKTMWRNAFTACGIQVPVTAGEAADSMATELSKQAEQEEIQGLEKQVLEARAVSNDFAASLAHARREM